MIGSFLGAWFPVFAARHKGVAVPGWAFFIAKYSWVEGICLIVIFAMFILEFMAMRYATFGYSHSHEHEHDVEMAHQAHAKKHDRKNIDLSSAEDAVIDADDLSTEETCAGPHVPGDDHLSHGRNHNDIENDRSVGHRHGEKTFDPDSYAAQMTAIAILEFGVIFHSIFIGLTLAVAGAEFTTLYVVLAFHQTFEGLALGTRLASIKWPSSSRWTPYVLGFCYALSTPIAIAVGLGIRTHFAPGSQTTLIVNGVFDSISAGILIYTGLIELMAHEFMFSEYMQKAPIGEVLSAIGCMCLGAGLMALLGKWA
ncbi:low-affinity Zn(2+) transporter zrt2 [Recurvomyces mirabilis]|uniref:Low-affinity Zn(2+) transporter zrt2 n=1 Tax=Recurvomyces mirabilis TaxID=574656 RepID=A0AAE0WNZ1_9PEZI|nr:low-affinity Zn(2+) transporter zrt2 [Recurvomyces mirabilis]KAK5157919.1 low-affinity Zn(2+) transporter zrt2 [Recurvomyces mirabilis]